MSTELPKRVLDSRGETELQCTIIKVASADREGRPAFGQKSKELCFVLKMPGDDIDISARIGSSPDHPLTPPRREDAILLLRITTQANVDDVIEVAEVRLMVKAIWPSYDSVGKLACYVVHAIMCGAATDEVRDE
jgi:hypothetical protein